MEPTNKKDIPERPTIALPSDENVSIGEQLRNQRKARGISLVEVSEHTKIGKKYLEAFEDSNFDILPCETYIRGFLRAYAKYLEIDDEKLIEQYSRQRSAQKSEVEKVNVTEEKSRKNNQTVWIPLLSIIVLAGLGAGLFLLWPTTEQESASVPEAVVSETADTDYANGSVDKLPGPNEDMTLKIRAKESTWITVMADGRQEPDITLNPGQERVWKAKDRFVLWTGNAGGIEVVFNGKLQPPLGTVGEVRKEVVFERQVPVPTPSAE